jgi:hypothetical protein
VTELHWLGSELKELQVVVRQTDNGQDIVRTLSTANDDFRCSQQGLEVSYFEAVEQIARAMYAKGSRLFVPASDGSIVMTESAAGLIRVTFVLPLAGDVTFSARWMPHRQGTSSADDPRDGEMVVCRLSEIRTVLTRGECRRGGGVELKE